jgi:hypothetical protein
VVAPSSGGGTGTTTRPIASPSSGCAARCSSVRRTGEADRDALEGFDGLSKLALDLVQRVVDLDGALFDGVHRRGSRPTHFRTRLHSPHGLRTICGGGGDGGGGRCAVPGPRQALGGVG